MENLQISVGEDNTVEITRTNPTSQKKTLAELIEQRNDILRDVDERVTSAESYMRSRMAEIEELDFIIEEARKLGAGDDQATA